jgi:hypothetical protein
MNYIITFLIFLVVQTVSTIITKQPIINASNFMVGCAAGLLSHWLAEKLDQYKRKQP